MDAPTAFLLVSLWGAAFTALALRPPRRPFVLVAVTFFAAWLTTELALLHLCWQVVATVAFIAAGALDEWTGVVALGVTLLSWVGLAAAVLAAHRTDRIFSAALEGALGPAAPTREPERLGPPRPGIEWARVFLPFHFRRRGVERTRNLAYVDGGGRRHQLDVLRRPDSGPGAPVMLHIHGGGWMISKKEHQSLPLLYHFASRGWVCVTINYRLSPRATWPDQIVDCKRALAWVREHIAEFGGDPEYVVVTGGSAGGHLSALMGLTSGRADFQPGFEQVDTRVRAFISFYGIFDLLDRWGIRGKRDPLRQGLERYVFKQTREEAYEVFDAASPVSHVSADAPPALVIHGDRDTLSPVEDAKRFVGALREAGASPVVFVELAGAHHAFEVFHSIRTLHAISGVDRFCSWLLAHDPPAAFSQAARPQPLEIQG